MLAGPDLFEPLPGGLTNQNRLVRCLGEGFVVRLGVDNAAHSIDRGIEARISAAAARIGLAPELIHAGGGFMVLRHIEGRALAAADLASAHHLGRAIHLLRRCRDDMPAACNFPLPDRAPIRILARYLEVLAAPAQRWHDSPMRLAPRVAALTRRLESRSLGFAHNDIHAGNLIDDGARLWLIDWEYAGAGDPLIDLASLINNGGVAQADIADAAALWRGAAADRSIRRAWPTCAWPRRCAIFSGAMCRTAFPAALASTSLSTKPASSSAPVSQAFDFCAGPRWWVASAHSVPMGGLK